MAYQSVLYEVEQDIAVITLNRPEALNALSVELEGEMHAALDEADADPAVRAVVLTGAGRAFSAGYDMSSASGRERRDPHKMPVGDYLRGSWVNDSKNPDKMMHLWHLGLPVIAAVNGWAMGGGFWYTLAADITIASEQAVFGQPEVRHTSNTTFLLAALCGWKVANRFALTGDHIDAQEALRVGIVNEVVPHADLLPAAKKLAHRIAMVPEPSVRYNKYITMMGMEAALVRPGLILNSALSVLAHSSHLPVNDALNEARQTGGVRSFLEMRDGPFQPEPFGPRSKLRDTAETSG